MTPARVLLIATLTFGSCTFTQAPLPLPPSFQTLESAVEEGASHKAYLGLETELNQPEDVFSLDIPPGVRVVHVEEDSPAANAGMVIGDTLLTFDGMPTDDPARLETLLAAVEQAGEVKLELQRGSAVLEATVQLEMRSTSRLRALYHIDRGLLRAAFRNNPRGLPEVVKIAPESPLGPAGVRVGDVIHAFQGMDPGSAEEFVRRARLSLEPGDPVVLEVVGPKGSRRVIETFAWDPGTAWTEFALWPIFSWTRELGQNRGEFRIGTLLITDLFRYSRDGEEREYSILSLLHWETGELVLEEGLDQPSESRP
ncbi:MAG: PDZ domain-containing protein [Planctomycetota bacterium]